MNFSSWNVRGLNRPEMHPEIRYLISSSNLSFVGLLETKVRASKLALVKQSVLPASWKEFAIVLHCN